MLHPTQALKDQDTCNTDCARAYALAAAIHEVRLTMVKEQTIELYDKEITGCALATD